MPPTASTWRVKHEQNVLAARDALDVAIVRPAMVYGRSSWIFTPWWGPLLEAAKNDGKEAVKVPVGIEARPCLVHVDDVVDGFHKVVDRVHGGLGSWPVFDLVAERVEVVPIMEAAREVLGVKGELEWAGTQGNAFFEALGLRTSVDGARARVVLGWEAKRRGFLEALPVFVRAWKAAEESK